MLIRLTAVGLLSMVAAACGSAPPSGTEPPQPVATARWVADDDSVVAVNLVVPAETDPQRTRALAEAERTTHPTARGIVRLFSATAGPERYDLGHVPAAGEPLVQASPPPSLLRVYDFPPRPRRAP